VVQVVEKQLQVPASVLHAFIECGVLGMAVQFARCVPELRKCDHL
jgi:hypothetical protein